MTYHEYETEELWEKDNNAIAKQPVLTIKNDEEIYKCWVMLVSNNPKFYQVKILSKRKKSDGKVKIAIVWEWLDKTKEVVLSNWFNNEKFWESVTYAQKMLNEEFPHCKWQEVKKTQFHFNKKAD